MEAHNTTLTKREKLTKILLVLAIAGVGLSLAHVFLVVPGGATAEEVIRDSTAIKTEAQLLFAFGILCGYIAYRLSK